MIADRNNFAAKQPLVKAGGCFVLVHRIRSEVTKYKTMTTKTEIIEEPDIDLDTLLDEFKNEFTLNNDDAEDVSLTRKLWTAISQFEHETCGTPVFTTTYKQSFSCWADVFNLSKGFIEDIEAVKYLDEEGAEQELDADDWHGESGRIGFVVIKEFPELDADHPFPVWVEYTAGIAPDPEYLPNDVVVAILEHVGHLYRYRESHDTDAPKAVPLAYESIIWKYRTGRI